MSRKVNVNITMNVILDVEEGTSVDDVINELDVTIKYDLDDNAAVVDYKMGDYDITDSR